MPVVLDRRFDGLLASAAASQPKYSRTSVTNMTANDNPVSYNNNKKSNCYSVQGNSGIFVSQLFC